MNKYIVVIGASNIDIGGQPYRKLVAEDSNPGRINISFGGVGRNIAHNLSLLGVSTKLITAAGEDILGKEMISYCNKAGIDTDYSVISDRMHSSMYIYINDDKGNMKLAVSHVEITDLIDPDYIDSVKDVINGADALITDSNISEKSLLHLKKISRVPIYIDTVSTSHSSKLVGNLEGIDTIKPNKIEAEYLTGISIRDDNDYISAAESFINQGVRRVFISAGSEGIIAADRNSIYKVSPYPADIVSTTGAGDSVMSAIAWASTYISDDISYIAKAANAVASMTLEVKETNNPDLSSDSVINKIKTTDIKTVRLK